MISDVREKGSLIEVYDANSKRISYMSAGNKELAGVASSFFVIVSGCGKEKENMWRRFF